jgi:hypothetical protein
MVPANDKHKIGGFRKLEWWTYVPFFALLANSEIFCDGNLLSRAPTLVSLCSELRVDLLFKHRLTKAAYNFW